LVWASTRWRCSRKTTLGGRSPRATFAGSSRSTGRRIPRTRTSRRSWYGSTVPAQPSVRRAPLSTSSTNA